MAKTRERSEVEYLRAENKRLKSENRHLKKEINKTGKKIRQYEAQIDLAEPDMPEVSAEEQSQINCKEPGCEGRVTMVDLGVRLMRVCDACGQRKTYKK